MGKTAITSWDRGAKCPTTQKSKSLFKNWDPEILDLYLKYGMVDGESGGLQLACSPSTEAALFMGSTSLDPWPLMEKVTCPVLILEGSESENRHMIDYKKTASMFPMGQYRLIEGAGHLIPMEKPREITGIIRQFFLQS